MLAMIIIPRMHIYLSQNLPKIGLKTFKWLFVGTLYCLSGNFL
jgi:hypothetical protein